MGFYVATQTTLEPTTGNITEGAIAGVVIGWMLGATAVYLLGLWLIFWVCKRREGREGGQDREREYREAG
jgi:hypothetical protein